MGRGPKVGPRGTRTAKPNPRHNLIAVIFMRRNGRLLTRDNAATKYQKFQIHKDTHTHTQIQKKKVSRHFGPKTFRHHQNGTKVSGQFGSSAKVSSELLSTGTELSRVSTSSKHCFATIGHMLKYYSLLLVKRSTDFTVIHKNTPPRTSH